MRSGMDTAREGRSRRLRGWTELDLDELLPRLRALLRFAAALSIATLIALAWSLTPLKDLSNLDAALALAERWADAPLAPLYAVGVYVVAGLAFVPVTLMVTVTGLVFGPLKGFAVAMVASVVAAAVTFAIGALLGRDLIRRLSGPLINRISERLSRRGTFTVALLRMVPVAPFSLINLAAGAIRIRLGDFLAGTILGMAPGMAALTVFGDRIEALLRDPSPGRIALLLLALGLAIVLTAALQGTRAFRAVQRTLAPLLAVPHAALASAASWSAACGELEPYESKQGQTCHASATHPSRSPRASRSRPAVRPSPSRAPRASSTSSLIAP